MSFVKKSIIIVISVAMLITVSQFLSKTDNQALYARSQQDTQKEAVHQESSSPALPRFRLLYHPFSSRFPYSERPGSDQNAAVTGALRFPSLLRDIFPAARQILPSGFFLAETWLVPGPGRLFRDHRDIHGFCL